MGPPAAPRRGTATVAGVGNIYADEALHLARIDPRRSAGGLTVAEVARLHAANSH